MKFKVIQGQKGQGEKGNKQDTQNQTSSEKPVTSEKPDMPNALEDYYAKESPHSQDMEQAEGDEDIVDDALKNQGKTGDAA